MDSEEAKQSEDIVINHTFLVSTSYLISSNVRYGIRDS